MQEITEFSHEIRDPYTPITDPYDLKNIRKREDSGSNFVKYQSATTFSFSSSYKLLLCLKFQVINHLLLISFQENKTLKLPRNISIIEILVFYIFGHLNQILHFGQKSVLISEDYLGIHVFQIPLFHPRFWKFCLNRQHALL